MLVTSNFSFSSLCFSQIYIFSALENAALCGNGITNLSRFCFLGTLPVLAPDVLANEIPKVGTRSRKSYSGTYDCKDDALPHDYGDQLLGEQGRTS